MRQVVRQGSYRKSSMNEYLAISSARRRAGLPACASSSMIQNYRCSENELEIQGWRP
jgi:hypothetical protein